MSESPTLIHPQVRCCAAEACHRSTIADLLPCSIRPKSVTRSRKPLRTPTVLRPTCALGQSQSRYFTRSHAP